MSTSSRPVVLVTGASRGLGQALAAGFARGGYDVGVHYNTNESGAKETASLVEKAGGRSLLLQADVRNPAAVNAMVDRLVSAWNRIDVLVNNAGLVRNKPIARMNDDEWRDVISGNLDGTFFCCRAVLPVMRKAGAGVILTMSSYVADRGTRGAANYAAAKAGIVAFTKSLAQEEAGNNIRANAIVPGFHVTDINRDYWNKFEDKVREQHLLDRMPDREELADFVVNVAKLSSVTGQTFAFESRIL